MSTQTPVHLPCGGCGVSNHHLVTVVANLPKRPDLERALLAGNLNLLTCPSCGFQVRFIRTVATIDFERKEWVYAFPRAFERHWQDLTLVTEGAFRKNMRFAAPAFVRDDAPSWKVRTAIGLDGLREKRVISNLGLDEIAVETAKLHLLAGRAEWAGAPIWFLDVAGARLRWRVEGKALVETDRSILDEPLPDGLLPGALGCDSFVSHRRFLVAPVPADPALLNVSGRWDVAAGGGDPREPLIRF